MEVDVEIAGLLARLLVAFANVGVIIVLSHASLHLDLLVDDHVADVLAVETDCLPLIADGLHAASVELLQGRRNHDFNGGHGRKSRLVNAAKS